MKILVLSSFYPNNYRPLLGIFFRDHAFALQTAGHEVIVLAVVAISLKEIWKQKKITFGFTRQNDAGLATYRYEFPSIPKLKWLNNKIRSLIGWQLYRIIRKEHGIPNLVHLHSFTAGDLARKIKQRDAVPYAITEHSTAFARNLLSPWEKRLSSRVFGGALIRTAVSEPFRDLLTKRYGFPFVYTPNPVGLYNNLASIEEHRIDKHNIRICNIGYLDMKKRQDRLIRAFNLVISKYPEMELHIAGDGPEREMLEKLVLDLGLASHVTFHGLLQRPEIVKLLHSCDIFALSSDYETFGVVVIEAMACGLPVVSTRCGGPESIITDDWLGLLTQKDDISFTQGLLDIVKRVRENRFDPRRISAHAYNVYSYEAIGQRMTEFFSLSLDHKD
jgi:L-malate glycosyltransferase